jgi:uncharacterized protein
MTIVARVAALTIYPIKSTAGTSVETLPLDGRGAIGDRRWLLVDHAGHAITARECHPLLRITPIVSDGDRDGAITLTAAGMPPLLVAVPSEDAPRRLVRVWDDDVEALIAPVNASAWCQAVLGRPCTLVRLGASSWRPLQPRYAGPLPTEQRDVAFTDGAPLLLIGLPSIGALNDRLLAQGHSAQMDPRRFRANVWLEGLGAHEEDRWRAIRIGSVELGLGTLCARCVLTTVDPDTHDAGHEPLRTLAGYRRIDGQVMFGVNGTHAAPGCIRVGDAVEVRAWR